MENMSITVSDIVSIVKEFGDEEKPISSPQIAVQLGLDPSRVAASLSTFMKKEKHLHRRPIEGGKGFEYWYDVTKTSQFFKDYKNGRIPKRGSAGRETANNPVKAPIMLGTTHVTGIIIEGIVFLTVDGKKMFTAVGNLKEA